MDAQEIIVARSEEHFLEQLAQKGASDIWEQSASEYDERRVNQMLKTLSQSDAVFQILELQDYQKKEIADLRAKIDALPKFEQAHMDKVGMEQFIADSERAVAEKKKLNKQIYAVLLPHQNELIASLNIRAKGIPKALTETPLGDAFKLTDGQKARIKESSDELAKKIHDFVHEARRDAFDILNDELTESQMEKLHELFGESLDGYFESTRLDEMFHFHLYSPESIPGIEKFQHPGHSLLKTEVKKEE